MIEFLFKKLIFASDEKKAREDLHGHQNGKWDDIKNKQD